MVELNRAALHICECARLQTSHVALDLKLRIFGVSVAGTPGAFELDEEYLGWVLLLPQSVDVIEDQDVRTFIAICRRRKCGELDVRTEILSEG